MRLPSDGTPSAKFLMQANCYRCSYNSLGLDCYRVRHIKPAANGQVRKNLAMSPRSVYRSSSKTRGNRRGIAQRASTGQPPSSVPQDAVNQSEAPTPEAGDAELEDGRTEPTWTDRRRSPRRLERRVCRRHVFAEV